MYGHDANFGRIVRYSVGHGTDCAVLSGEAVVLLPQPAQGEIARSSDIRLGEAFSIAERLLREGQRVRVVATGASLRDSWPEWVEGATGLVTTELGAYRPVHPIVATRALARDAHDWLHRIAGRSGSGDDGVSETLFASLASRVLQPLFEAVAYAQGLVAVHPGATFHCVDADWVGLDYLRALATPNGSAVMPPALVGTSRWRGRLAAHLGWRLLLAIAGQLRRYGRSAQSRRALRRRRRAGSSPRLWLALQPDWPRINRHVLGQLDAARTDYGILLTTTLESGDTTQPGHAGPLWPGIPDDLIDEASSVPLDQVAGPGNVASLVVGLAKGIGTSLRAAWRVLKGDDAFLTLAGGLRGRAADGVARLLTIDLIQTIIVGDAVRALARRHALHGSVVVFANLNLTDTAAADRALRDAGAFTVDFRHGSGGGGWFGMHESFADHVLVWSATDLALTDMLSRSASTTSPPPLPPPAPAHATPIRRVLVVTGYSHDCWLLSGFPLRPFEIELLRGVEQLWRQNPEYEIRWRPHPSDDPEEVAARLARFPFLARSQTADLAGDLAWADLVISYGGTTLGEAVRAGVPVIVHVAPDLLAYPDVAAVPMGRSFFYATQLPGLVARLVEARDSDPAVAASVDHRLFDALFAPTAATVTGLDFSVIVQPG